MSTPATVPLIPQQINAVMQNVVLNALSIVPGNGPGQDPLAYSKVRIGWQRTGAPDWLVTDDVAFVRSIEEDDEYNRIRDEEIDVNENDPTTLIDTVKYTRVWRVFFTLYGPNAFDHGRMLKSALFTPNQAIHDLLVNAHLCLVMDIQAPKYVPEEYDSQWWDRIDFECLFNEGVEETTTLNTVTSVQVTIETTGGQINVVEGYGDDPFDTGGFDSNS